MSEESRNMSGCQVFNHDTLPSDWDCVPLGERIQLLYGRALREEDRAFGNVPVYGSNGIVGTHKEGLINGPGIVVGRKGSVGTVNYSAGNYWPIDTAYYVGVTATDDLRFVYYLLQYLPLDFLNAATGVPGLSRRDAYALRGAFPPPDEQATIAQILDAADAAIERTREAIVRVQDLQESLLTNVFEQMEAEHLRLGNFIAEAKYGTSQASSERQWGNPVLRIPNVVGDQLSVDDLAFVDLRQEEVERLTLQNGDLLVVRSNGNPSYVGRSAVFNAPDSRTWVYASYLIRVRLTGDLLPEYVNIFLGTEPGRRELLRRVTTSAGNNNINTNSIRLLPIPVPKSQAVQAQVIQIAQACRSLLLSHQNKLQSLVALKKSLMHDLLSGSVRVKTVHNNPQMTLFG